MLTFGSPLYAYTQVSSTMDTARDLLKSGAPPGTAVITQTQSAGRGRQGRIWHSAPGNLHLTVIGAPVLTELRWQISLIVGLAAIKSLEKSFSDLSPISPISLRFPNDLYKNQKKWGGILVEFEQEIPLIGIGMNFIPVHTEIEKIATHLEISPLSLNSIQENLFLSLSQVWEHWQTNGIESLLPDWHARLGKYERLFTLPSKSNLLASVLEVKPDGTVILQDSDSTLYKEPIAHLNLSL